MHANMAVGDLTPSLSLTVTDRVSVTNRRRFSLFSDTEYIVQDQLRFELFCAQVKTDDGLGASVPIQVSYNTFRSDTGNGPSLCQ